MSTYYTGKRAKSYNRVWRTFSEKTIAETCSIIDFTQLEEIASAREDPPRILDVACGTGLLLQRLATQITPVEVYGLDESEDMLTQARLLLGSQPNVHLTQTMLKGEKMTGLPYKPASFDLITCTNALHYMDDPVAVLRGLAALLNSQGRLIIEDYARRTFPFPWRLLEWIIKCFDSQHVEAYTLTEAYKLCQRADLQVLDAKSFPIDMVWRGWVIETGIGTERKTIVG